MNRIKWPITFRKDVSTSGSTGIEEKASRCPKRLRLLAVLLHCPRTRASEYTLTFMHKNPDVLSRQGLAASLQQLLLAKHAFGEYRA